MSPQWIPQNIQKRLFRYILQQLSLFSEIDLSDLDVSLGNLNLKNVLLNPESFKVPGLFLRSGQINNLNLNLTVSDGIVINGEGIEVILVLAPSNTTLANKDWNYDEKEFSLAQSRADLASSIMATDGIHGDEVFSDDDGSSNSSASNDSNAKRSSNHNNNNNNNNNNSKGNKDGATFYSSYVNKAVEIALAKLQFNVTNVLIKVIINEGTGIANNTSQANGNSFFIQVDKISWDYNTENAKAVNVEGLKIFTETEKQPTPKHHGSPFRNFSNKKAGGLDIVKEETNGSENVSDDDDDDDKYNSDNEDYSQMMTSSYLPTKKHSEDATTEGESSNHSNNDDNDDDDDDDDDDESESSTMFMSANSNLSQVMMTLNKIKEQPKEEEEQDEQPARAKSSDLEKERLINSIYETATGNSVMDSHLRSSIDSGKNSRRSSNSNSSSSSSNTTNSVNRYSSIASQEEERNYLISISSIILNFVGLLDIENLDILIDQINVSAKDSPESSSIFDIVLNFIKQFEKVNKMNAYMAKKSKLKSRNYSKYTTGSQVIIGNNKASEANTHATNANDDKGPAKDELHWFSKLHINQLSVNFDSYLSPDGSFEASNDVCLILEFGNTKVVKKNSFLIYGGVETAKLVDGANNKSAFNFSDGNTLDSKDKKEEDLRFEYLINQKNSAADVTVLCSKIGNLDLDITSVSKLLAKGYKIAAIAEAFSKLQTTLSVNSATQNRQPGSLASSLIFQKQAIPAASHNSKNTFTFQSNSFNTILRMPNASSAIFMNMLPINYSSNPSRLECPKILVYSISADSDIEDTVHQKPILTISKIILSSYNKGQQVKSFDLNNKETLFSADSILNVDNVQVSHSFEESYKLVMDFKNFSEQLPKKDAADTAALSEPNVLMSSRNNRKVRISNTVHFNTHSNIKLHINISSIKAFINKVNEPFGDLNFNFDHTHVNIFSDFAIQLLLKRLSVYRVYGSRWKDVSTGAIKEEQLDGKNTDGLEQVIGISNPEDNILPLVGIKFANGSGRGFVRNLKIEYYSSWLSLFQKDENESSANDLGNSSQRQQPLQKSPSFSSSSASSSPANKPASFTFNNKNAPTSSTKLRLVDCVIGLNPGRLHSKALLLVDRGDVDVYVGNEVFAKTQLRNISLLLIDDIENILGYADTRKHRQWMTNKRHRGVSSSIPSWSQLSWYLSRGFISVGAINSLNLSFIKNNEAKLKKMTGKQNAIVDLKIDADVCKIELCADSSQALTQLLADLKQPVILTDEQKFRFSAHDEKDGKPLNVFDALDDTFFEPPSTLNDTILLSPETLKHKKNRKNVLNSDDDEYYGPGLDVEDIDDMGSQENLLDVVEDYYGSRVPSSKNSSSSKSSQQADNILSQDLNDLALQSRKDKHMKNNLYYTGNSESFENSADNSNGSSLSFAENHFNDPKDSVGSDEDTFSTVPVKVHFIVNKVGLFLHDGYDWAETRQAIKKAVKLVEDTGFEAINKVMANKPPKKRRGIATAANISAGGNAVADLGKDSNSRPEMYSRNRRDSLGDFGFRPFPEDDDDDDNDDVDDAGDEEDDDEDFAGGDYDHVADEEESDQLVAEYGNANVIDQKLFDSIHISLPVGADPKSLTSGINRIINDSDAASSISSMEKPATATAGTSREAQLVADKKTNYKKLKLRRSKYHKLNISITDLEVDCIVFNSADPDYNDENLKRAEDEDDSDLLFALNVKAQDFEIIDNIPTSTWNKFVIYMREAGDREVGVSIFNFTMETYRPVSTLAATEAAIKVSVLPLRLHVDQDALEFLTRFGGFKDKRFLFDEMFDDILFIQKFQINSVHIKLDYKPKKVDYFGIRSGNTTEFMNFFILDGADILLKKLTLYGVPGMPRLNDSLNALWMPDIRTTQLKGIISGLAPSVSKIGGGIKDLVVVPVNEYKKDGRLVNSIQKGAYAFVRTTTNELLRFGVKVAAGTQTILENTEEALGGTGSSSRLPKDVNYEIHEIKDDHYDRIKNKSKKRVSGIPLDMGASYIGTSSFSPRVSSQGGAGRTISQVPTDSFGEFSEIATADEVYNSITRTGRRKIHPHSNSNSIAVHGNVGSGNNGSGAAGATNSRYYSEVFSDSEDEEIDLSDYDSDDDDSSEQQKIVSLYADQPVDAKEGFVSAYGSFGKNFMLARDAMVKAGGNAADSGSAKKAVYVIAKAAPVAVIRPIIGATEALSKTLLGVTNQINPEQRLDANEKYKQGYTNWS